MKKTELKKWFNDTIIRTVKTMAETASGIVITGVVMSDIDWMMLLSATALSGIACILINVKNIPGGEADEDVKQE